MTALLTDNLPLLAGAPNGIKKLRELILELAVRGKLVEQDVSDEPASELLKRIAAEKARLVANKAIKATPQLDPVSDSEELFDIPPAWAWVRMGEICRPVSSGSTPSSELFKYDEGVPFLKVYNIRNQEVDFDYKRQFVSYEHHSEKMKRSILVPGDVLMNIVGPPLGKVAIVPNIFPEWNCNQAIVFFGLIQPMSPEYVFTFLKEGSFLRNIALIGTAGQDNISVSKSKNIAVPIPPLSEQHRIVAKVDELMALCDRLESQQAEAASAHAQLVQTLLGSLIQASDATEFAANWQRLAEHFHTLFSTEPSIDALKQTLLQLAVMGKLVPQDPSDEPAIELLGRIAEEKARLVAEGKIKKQKVLSEIGEEERAFELPQGWQWARKADVFSFLNGYAFKSEWFRPEGIRLLRNVNVSHGVINWKETACISEEQAAEFQGFSLEENDVVLTLDRPIISTGLKYAVIRSADLPCLLLQRVAKIAPYAGAVTVSYLSAWLNSRFFVDSIDPGRSNGVPHISTNQVANMPFALPPLAEQHRIVAKVDQLMALCDQLKTQLSQARQLNQQLASTLVEQAVA